MKKIATLGALLVLSITLPAQASPASSKTTPRHVAFGSGVQADLWTLQGTVYGSTYCEQDMLPLPGAQVIGYYSLDDETRNWVVYSNSEGKYAYWNPDPMLMDVYTHYPGFTDVTLPDIYLEPGQTMSLDLSLHLALPCLRLNPQGIQALLRPGEQVSIGALLDNTGFAEAVWTLSETAEPLGDAQDFAWLSASQDNGLLSAISSLPLDIILFALPELPEGSYIAYLQLDSNDPYLPSQSISVTMQVGSNFSFLPVVLH